MILINKLSPSSVFLSFGIFYILRGIQLALGLVFLRKGIELIVSRNIFISNASANIDGPNINLIIGIAVFIMVLFLLDNKKLPAAIAAVGVCIIMGFIFGGFKGENISFGPTDVHLVFPSLNDFWIAFIMLILPQIPLTIGNACVGTADTCSTLFPKSMLLQKTTAGKFALTMGIANLPAGFIGAVPMCHGTGGLAAHYRFGARTGGAPLIIGILFVLMALLFGELGFSILAMIPNGVLGVLLIFAGLELCPLIRSLETNEEYFTALLISGIALTVPNMAWAFGIGILTDFFIRKAKIKI